MSGFEIDVVLERRARQGPVFRLEVRLKSGPGVTVVFGPSGAGKTTLLEAVLGALRPERGRIAAAGRVLFDSRTGVDLPVRRRRVGVVFQDALLFPHLTVRRNVEFGAGGERHEAASWLDRVGASELAGRMPRELSGGQRQRVALARALAARPAALLLDEPFSSLDAASRETLGETLLRLQVASKVPFLLVTHDVGEALRLGTEMVVLDEGRVTQSGPPTRVVAAPSSAAAARAVGTENLFRGAVVRHDAERGHSEVDLGGVRVQTGVLALAPGERVVLGLRAEDILLSLEPLERTSARNVLAGTIEQVARRGTAVEVRVRTPLPFRVLVTPAAVRELGLQPGRSLHLLIKASSFHRLV